MLLRSAIDDSRSAMYDTMDGRSGVLLAGTDADALPNNLMALFSITDLALRILDLTGVRNFSRLRELSPAWRALVEKTLSETLLAGPQELRCSIRRAMGIAKESLLPPIPRAFHRKFYVFALSAEMQCADLLRDARRRERGVISHGPPLGV